MQIERIYHFLDSTKPMVPVQVEMEIQSVTEFINNLLSGVVTINSLVFQTPDGLHTYKLSADNNGNMQWIQVS